MPQYSAIWRDEHAKAVVVLPSCERWDSLEICLLGKILLEARAAVGLVFIIRNSWVSKFT